MSHDIPPLRIGALARLSGATPKALRLYGTLGLIPRLGARAATGSLSSAIWTQ